jgi:peptide/nickel transport system ATP-binding protein
MSSLLTVDDVHVHFHSPGGEVRALDGVSIEVNKGETLAVVGESGCGKTTLARVILGLQPTVSGSVTFEGKKISKSFPGIAEKIGMVWQDPFASLDPRWKVGRAILEPLAISGKKGNAAELFKQVGLSPDLVDRYPHQLSGGQRQRVAIGRALSTRPPLVICDEPTAALDLSIRAQVLNLLRDLQSQIGCSFLYISHDLTTVRFLADRVAVMYLGRIVEIGSTEQIFDDPRHPYTKALLDSAPSIDKLMQLPEAPQGEIPDPRTRFVGCRYASRCPNATEICLEKDPEATVEDGRKYYSHHPVGQNREA